MPHESLHRVAEKLPDPSDVYTVGTIHMIARCGSTLLRQMMNAVPAVRTISEPFGLSALHQEFSKGNITWAEYDKLFVSVIKVLCKKSDKDDKITHLIFKLSQFSSVQTPLFKRHFPNFIHIFNTREPKFQTESVFRLATSLPKLNRYSGIFAAIYKSTLPFPYEAPEEFVEFKREILKLRGIKDEEICALNTFGISGVYYTVRKHRDCFAKG